MMTKHTQKEAWEMWEEAKKESEILAPIGEYYNGRIAELKQQNADLLAALKAIEWDFENECPLCFRTKDLGHMEDCKVGLAIAKAEGGAE